MGTLTDRVRNHVLEAITQGKFGIGAVLPATEEIAEEVKCSSGTVRKALMDLANEGVLKRIQRRGTVVARKPSTGSVCLILPQDAHTNLLFQDVVHSALIHAGYAVDLIPTAMGLDAVQVHLNQLLSTHVPDCLVSLEPSPSLSPIIESISKRSAVRVAFQFDNESLLPNTQLITIDHQRAARDVVEHLLKLGHRKIAIVGGGKPNDNSWAGVAAAHCRDLLEVAGAEYIPYYLFESGGHAALLQRFMREGVTAYWAITDHEATQLVNLCYQSGLKIPQDVSIVGRHDTPWARDCRPPLTTVSLNPEGVAAAIVDALHAQRSDPNQVRKVFKVQPKLIARESTGPVRWK